MNTTTDLISVPAASSKTGPSISTLVALLAGAVLPVLVALVLLGSALLQRPLFGRLVRRWPALARAVAAEGHGVVTRMTVAWGIGLLVIGALQGAAELLECLSAQAGVGVRDLFLRSRCLSPAPRSRFTCTQRGFASTSTRGRR